MYIEGVKVAAETVGLGKKLRQILARVVSGAAGEPLVRLPIASTLGAGSGYLIGRTLGSEHPERQAATGAVVPIVGTTGTLLSIPLREKLIKALSR